MPNAILCPVVPVAVEALLSLAERADLDDACGCGDWDEVRTSAQVRDTAIANFRRIRHLPRLCLSGCGALTVGSYAWCDTCHPF